MLVCKSLSQQENYTQICATFIYLIFDLMWLCIWNFVSLITKFYSHSSIVSFFVAGILPEEGCQRHHCWTIFKKYRLNGINLKVLSTMVAMKLSKKRILKSVSPLVSVNYRRFGLNSGCAILLNKIIQLLMWWHTLKYKHLVYMLSFLKLVYIDWEAATRLCFAKSGFHMISDAI